MYVFAAIVTSDVILFVTTITYSVPCWGLVGWSCWDWFVAAVAGQVLYLGFGRHVSVPFVVVLFVH